MTGLALVDHLTLNPLTILIEQEKKVLYISDKQFSP